jgi:hydroxyacylglutathione hydrolase
MILRPLRDPHLAQVAYLIGCQKTKEALLIDPERDVDRYLRAAADEGLRVTAVAETHIHADFLSGARELAEHGVRVYVSAEGGPDWQVEWARDYDAVLLRDGDTFHVGNIEVRAVHTPGHTPEHLAFLVTDAGSDEPIGMISGDFVFVGDLGRPDLLETAAGEAQSAEPSARRLFESVERLGPLADYLQVWPGHGAGSACGKALGALPQTTLGYERRHSDALRAAEGGEDAFVRHILADQPEPPLYFARMKRENRSGPKLLNGLPRPQRLDAHDLDALPEGVTVVDTRDRKAFARGHYPGSLLAPFDQTFLAVVGSYVMPEEPLALVIREEDVEAAVRALVRIGLDDVRAYVTPEALAKWGAKDDRLRMMKTIDFDEVDGRRHYTNAAVLDVRRREEFELKHIPGALHVPHVRLREQLDELPRDKTLLVHCAGGGRATAAAALLHARGFSVAAVDDAFDRWKERHLEEGVTAGAH